MDACCGRKKTCQLLFQAGGGLYHGQYFAAYCIKNELKPSIMKTGIEYMMFLADWYTKNAWKEGIGFFQWRGISGDCPNLRGSHAYTGPGTRGYTFLELLLPD